MKKQILFLMLFISFQTKSMQFLSHWAAPVLIGPAIIKASQLLETNNAPKKNTNNSYFVPYLISGCVLGISLAPRSDWYKAILIGAATTTATVMLQEITTKKQTPTQPKPYFKPLPPPPPPAQYKASPTDADFGCSAFTFHPHQSEPKTQTSLRKPEQPEPKAQTPESSFNYKKYFCTAGKVFALTAGVGLIVGLGFRRFSN